MTSTVAKNCSNDSKPSTSILCLTNLFVFFRWTPESQLLMAQQRKQTVIVVGPQTQSGFRLNLFRNFGDIRPGEKLLVAGDQHPVCGRYLLFLILFRRDQNTVQTGVVSLLPQNRRKVQILAGYMKSQNAAWPQMPLIKLHRLRREQMHRDGVSGKGVN